MASRTITIDDEAYRILKAHKFDKTESFSDVILKCIMPIELEREWAKVEAAPWKQRRRKPKKAK